MKTSMADITKIRIVIQMQVVEVVVQIQVVEAVQIDNLSIFYLQGYQQFLSFYKRLWEPLKGDKSRI